MIKLFHGTTDVLYDKFIKKRGLLPPNKTGWHSIWKDTKEVHVRDDVIYLTEFFAYALIYGQMIVRDKGRVHKNIVVLEVEVDENTLEPEEDKRNHQIRPVNNWQESLYYFHSVQTKIPPKILRVGRIPYKLAMNDKNLPNYVYNYFDRGFIEKDVKDDEPTMFERLVGYDMYFAEKYCNWKDIEHPFVNTLE